MRENIGIEYGGKVFNVIFCGKELTANGIGSVMRRQPLKSLSYEPSDRIFPLGSRSTKCAKWVGFYITITKVMVMRRCLQSEAEERIQSGC